MDHKKETASLLQQISDELDQFTTNDTNTGLLGGYAGCALFYAYYYQITSRDEHLVKVHEIIQKCLQALSEEPMNGSHCSGIAGVAWCIQHLITMGFIEEDDMSDAFVDIDVIVSDFMEAELSVGRNDFLHQGLGTALYFLERLPNPTAQTHLEKIVSHLKNTAITVPTGITWKDQFSSNSLEQKDRNLFNMGLAHGVPAIIAVLARIYEKGIAVDTIAPLIEGSVKWLLAAKKPGGEKGHSLYPVMVDDANEIVNEAHSRLGWCYGDLGIATTLWGAGERLQRNDYKEEAHNIFKNIAQFRDVKNGAVHDACICHGSAGIAHILQQAAIATGDPLLKEGATDWLQTTLQMNTWTDGPAGFKFYHHPNYTNSYNVLEGIAGIGLSLISFLDTDTKPAWGNCLLIS
ncbi:lanthionine synthetase-like protein [Chitinophaga niastensis]|uniref:Lanthionine synthetase-like protein n=1 Tax=Chitinophaga niastensis TaxID=536980 RepID=A0A2P8HP52_CHINA|nr:lanthionine synthetase C family protein [Chitinophaga niastensis]PSL47996.1 lanthionine synthetase-like protein [Chitinophaga niastensis]